MQHLQLTIPAQDDSRATLKIKPREVRAWLDNLPFLDSARCARLAHEQLRLMNRQTMPAAARLEILGYFLGTYQRLAEQIEGWCGSKEAPAGTPADRDSDKLSALLRRLCQDIGFGYKIVTQELAGKSRKFIESRNLPLALLGAIHTLGLQLADCYSQYRPAPRSLWRECLALYAFAWQSGREKYSSALPGFDEQEIDANFRLTALLRLSDPYRLAQGMAVALRYYFAQHLGLCRILNEAPSSGCYFQLQEAFQLPPDDQEPHLYLELDELLQRIDSDIKKLQSRTQASVIGLPAEIPGLTLLHTLRQTLDHWRYHPTRCAQREETHTRIDLVNGVSAAYCMINHGRCFDPSRFLSAEAHSIDISASPAPRQESVLANTETVQDAPTPFCCSSINRSSGGLAIRYRGDQSPHPRVGQLIAVRRPSPKSNAGWVLAVCRWLVETEETSGFDLGLQYLTRDPRPVVIRKVDTTGLEGEYQAAIAATQKRAQTRVQTLITRSGDITAGSELALYEHGKRVTIHCSEQLESGPGFSRFIYKPA